MKRREENEEARFSPLQRIVQKRQRRWEKGEKMRKGRSERRKGGREGREREKARQLIPQRWITHDCLAWNYSIPPPPSRRNYPLALFATLSFNYASTTIFLASPRLVHLHPNPAGSPLVIIFPRVARALVGFLSARKTAVISRFCDDCDSGKGWEHHELLRDRLRSFESYE